MPDRLAALAEHVAAALPGAVTATEIRRGELCVQIERDALLRRAAIPARRPEMPLYAALRHLRRRLSRPRAALRCRLQPAERASQPAHPPQARNRRGAPGRLRDRAVQLGRVVGARDLGPVRHLLHRPPRSAPHPDRLRVRGSSDAQGFPADRLCRGALRRRAEAGRLRAGAAEAGIPLFRFPVAVGGHGQDTARATRRLPEPRRPAPEPAEAPGHERRRDPPPAGRRPRRRSRPRSWRAGADPQFLAQFRAAASGGARRHAAGARNGRRDHRARRPAYRVSAPRHREADRIQDLSAGDPVFRPARLRLADVPGARLRAGRRKADGDHAAAAGAVHPGAVRRDHPHPQSSAEHLLVRARCRRNHAVPVGVRGTRAADGVLRARVRSAAARELLPSRAACTWISRPR